MKQRDYNISKLAFGDVMDSSASMNLAGVDAIAFTEMTQITPGTLKNVSDDNEIKDFENAENDKVDFSTIAKKGSKKYEFQIFNANLDNLILAFGGVKVGSGWQAPTNAYGGIEKSLIIISRSVSGLKTTRFFPRVKITAIQVGEYTGDATNDIKFSFTVLSPVDAVSGANFSDEYVYSRANAPITATYVATTGVLTFEAIDGFDSATDYEYTENAGVAWVDFATNPETITTSLTAVGMRVKENVSTDNRDAQWEASEILNVTIT